MKRTDLEVVVLALGALAVCLLFAFGCTTPPVQPAPGPAPWLCAHAPDVIHYGSCGGKIAPGPATCVICEGALGCMAFQGVYCTGALSCDDKACK